MINFKQFISEAFNNPYEYKLVMTGRERKIYEFIFTSMGDNIHIIFTPLTNNRYDMEFQIPANALPYAKTNKFDAPRILSTVIAVLTKVLEREFPEKVFFSGDKEDGKSQLYGMMLKHFSRGLKKLGYTYSERDYPSFTVFIIKQQGI